MTIIFGFGSTEAEERKKIRRAVMGALIEGDSVRSALKPWNDKADKYDRMPRGEAPQRYTRIFYHSDALHFHHINREHALSPDGWALLEIEEPLEREKTDA